VFWEEKPGDYFAAFLKFLLYISRIEPAIEGLLYPYIAFLATGAGHLFYL
jgi:hypothetical protein